jgi:hypothetical protein
MLSKRLMHEVSITPEVFGPGCVGADRVKEMLLEELLTKVVKNGFLADLAGGQWRNQVQSNCCGGLSPDMQHRLKSFLSALEDRHRLVCHRTASPALPQNDLAWLEEALRVHRNLQLDGVVVDDALHSAAKDRGKAKQVVVSLSGIRDADVWNVLEQRSIGLVREQQHYEAAIEPLVRYSSRAWLIDGYMSNDPDGRYLLTVDIFAKYLARGLRNQHGEIFLHSGVPFQVDGPPRAPDDIYSDWGVKLTNLAGKYGHWFRMYVRPRGRGWRRMHDRYVFTDQMGVKVAGGLDCFHEDPAEQTHWVRLDDDDWDASYSRYKFTDDPEVWKWLLAVPGKNWTYETRSDYRGFKRAS